MYFNLYMLLLVKGKMISMWEKLNLFYLFCFLIFIGLYELNFIYIYLYSYVIEFLFFNDGYLFMINLLVN